LLLIAPATADCISKIAAGICDDAVTCVALSTKAPILIVPAMNENMYNNAILRGNIKKLEAIGINFAGPKKGKLACGSVGTGRIEETDEILKRVRRALSNEP